jgi:hypothetical protein
MKIKQDGIYIDEYNMYLERRCKESSCGKKYTIYSHYSNSKSFFYPPVNYVQGCSKYCLECWLDVTQYMDDTVHNEPQENHNLNLSFPLKHDHWYDKGIIGQIDSGFLSAAYEKYIADECHLVLLPLSRIVVDRSIFLPCGVMIYPERRLSFTDLIFDKNDGECKLSSLQSKVSGVSIKDYEKQPVLVMPIKLNWNALLNLSHQEHMDLIRTISEMFDSMLFNAIRYKHCELTYIPDEGLPNSAGQISSNSMMASALFLKNGGSIAKIVAGSAFTHRFTRGLGLVLGQPEWNSFPSGGEICNVIHHALFLYSEMLKTESSTSRFMQAMSLLEFLAYPKEYQKFKKVKSVISNYIARSATERQKILDRFEELTGKVDKNTNEQIGLRTRIVHIGARLENIVPFEHDRVELFRELDGYIRSVIDHMIRHSSLSFDEYEAVKENMEIRNEPIKADVHILAQSDLPF